MIDIEYLDSLPLRESHSKGIIRRYGSLYNVAKWEGWRNGEKHKYPWRIAEDICKRYIGQSYDEAYSKFCKKLKEYNLKNPDDKSNFIECFSGGLNRWGDEEINMFKVDEDKIISWDLRYFEEMRRWSKKSRKFKKEYPVLNGYYEVIEYKLKYNSYYLKTYISAYEYLNLNEYDKSKYESSKILREYITFDSKDDRSFKKYKQEERKLHKKLKRQEIKEKSQIKYCFLTDSEKKKIEDRKTDLIKRDSHGFDDESFKGEHYHGQKRKKKEVINTFESLNQLII